MRLCRSRTLRRGIIKFRSLIFINSRRNLAFLLKLLTSIFFTSDPISCSQSCYSLVRAMNGVISGRECGDCGELQCLDWWYGVTSILGESDPRLALDFSDFISVGWSFEEIDPQNVDDDSWTTFLSLRLEVSLSVEELRFDCLTGVVGSRIVWVSRFCCWFARLHFLKEFSWYSQQPFSDSWDNKWIVEWLHRIRTTMDVVISCQVIDYYFGKSSIRDEERSCFLRWVLQTVWVRFPTAFAELRCLGFLSLPDVLFLSGMVEARDRIALQVDTHKFVRILETKLSLVLDFIPDSINKILAPVDSRNILQMQSPLGKKLVILQQCHRYLKDGIFYLDLLCSE
ncbi:hypothetical protein Tco_0968889 [Tanacetum coccineum]